MTHFLTTALVVAFATTGTLAFAQSEAEPAADPATTLKTYAAMSRLETNLAKAAGSFVLAATPELPEREASQAIEEFSADAAQIERSILTLNEIELSKSNNLAVTAFAEAWALAYSEAQAILAEEEFSSNRLIAWWESLEAMDSLIEGQLDILLTDHDASL